MPHTRKFKLSSPSFRGGEQKSKKAKKKKSKRTKQKQNRRKIMKNLREKIENAINSLDQNILRETGHGGEFRFCDCSKGSLIELLAGWAVEAGRGMEGEFFLGEWIETTFPPVQEDAKRKEFLEWLETTPTLN
jgi:hypothetical protein